MSLPVFRKSVLAAVLSLAAVSGPLSAQAGLNSDSYNFLEAVRDRDGSKVTSIIDEPGSTLINTRDYATGDTALHIVAERQDTTWIKFLTQKGANPNIANKKGVTPIMISVGYGHVEGVEALLDAGARLTDQNGLGETPLILATHRRDIAMVRLLLAKGADPDRTDNSGRTARDYVRAIGSKRLTAEFDEADAKRDGQSGPSYGPGF
ncbi:ankyrin repeat domain-containing protein [Parerythrobacter aestuarii]|uniref:ankyrin repeat domain-containing protein n=1 Tax=Parerythrobacter aestuarii TaxID=3020909 RepID=UPI0024DECA89|nr:ankyrin repeat domain-containing protein [Parerythrobacter aestuarii]